MRKLAAALTAGVFLMAACGGSKTAAPAGKSGGEDHMKVACTAEGTVLKVTSKDTKFDRSCLAVKAGEAFTIELDNQDDFPHNVSIYKGKDENRIFEGKPFAEGMKTVTYSAPAIAEKGTFHFMCDIHPEMEGSFVVE